MFSQNCAIPQPANAVLGACWLVIGVGFVASELFLRASSVQSFADMDREKQAIVVHGTSWAVCHGLRAGLRPSGIRAGWVGRQQRRCEGVVYRGHLLWIMVCHCSLSRPAKWYFHGLHAEEGFGPAAAE
jgi:hypothetical protein